MYCHKCGAKLQKNIRYCQECGEDSGNEVVSTARKSLCYGITAMILAIVGCIWIAYLFRINDQLGMKELYLRQDYKWMFPSMCLFGGVSVCFSVLAIVRARLFDRENLSDVRLRNIGKRLGVCSFIPAVGSIAYALIYMLAFGIYLLFGGAR